MWGELCNNPVALNWQTLLALFGTGIVIKMMDDFLDREDHRVSMNFGGKVISKMSRGILPYILLLFLLSLAWEFRTGAAAFLAAYAVGMSGQDYSEILPSGLLQGFEVVIALALGLVVAGARLFLAVLFAMLTVQAIDDILDRFEDQITGKRSWYNQFGPTLTYILCITSALIAAALDYSILLLILLVSRIVAGIFSGSSLKMEGRMNGD